MGIESILIIALSLLLLFLLALIQGWLKPKALGGDETEPQWRESLVWGGFALTRLLLAGKVLEIFLLSVTAAPEARNGWSAFLGMVSFALLPWLFLGFLSDLRIKQGRWGGEGFVRDPFWATGYLDFWRRFGVPLSFTAQNRRYLMVLAIMAVTMFTLWWVVDPWAGGPWAGGPWHSGIPVWLGLQGILLLLDYGLAAWLQRVPRVWRSMGVTLLYMAGLPLLYMGGWEAALREWALVFNPPADTLYTLFLDRLLTRPSVCWTLWLAILIAVAMPGLRWWLIQKSRVRRLAVVTGYALLALYLMDWGLVRFSGPGRRWVQEARLWLSLAEGAGQVCRGADGWLYPKHELDRFTQKRDSPGMAEKVMELQGRLKWQGAELLLVMVPDKVWLYPEAVLPGKYWQPIYPPGYEAELKRLRDAGVDVLDFSDTLLWENRRRMPLYFKQDSGWRAEAMKEMAVMTARHVRKTYPAVVRNETPLISGHFIQRQDVGDLAWRLTPMSASLHWPQETTQMVGLTGLTDDGSDPVLLIGGDLMRMYDDDTLSFGPQKNSAFPPAGWPTQLGASLGRKLTLADQPWGEKRAHTPWYYSSLNALSYRMGVMLAQREAENPQPSCQEERENALSKLLTGKKLVIWLLRGGEL